MPNSVYAKAYYCAWDTDLGKIFVDTMQRIRKQGNLPPADFQIESQTPMQGNSGRTHAARTSLPACGRRAARMTKISGN